MIWSRNDKEINYTGSPGLIQEKHAGQWAYSHF